MTEKSDTRKDLLIGSVGTAAAITGAPALPVVVAGTLTAVAWNIVAGWAQRRATKLIDQMVNGDSEPESFRDLVQKQLDSGSDETIAAFRALLNGAVESVSPDALGPMAYVGRSYFRRRCSMHIARGVLELFQKVTATDLIVLERLMGELTAIDASMIVVLADASGRSDHNNKAWRAWPEGRRDAGEIDVGPYDNATYLFGLIKRAGLGQRPADTASAARRER